MGPTSRVCPTCQPAQRLFFLRIVVASWTSECSSQPDLVEFSGPHRRRRRRRGGEHRPEMAASGLRWSAAARAAWRPARVCLWLALAAAALTLAQVLVILVRPVPTCPYFAPLLLSSLRFCLRDLIWLARATALAISRFDYLRRLRQCLNLLDSDPKLLTSVFCCWSVVSVWIVGYMVCILNLFFSGFQAKKDLTEVTNKVYFDIEIDGKPAGLWWLAFSCSTVRSARDAASLCSKRATLECLLVQPSWSQYWCYTYTWIDIIWSTTIKHSMKWIASVVCHLEWLLLACY